jgi:hypothetical protein
MSTPPNPNPDPAAGNPPATDPAAPPVTAPATPPATPPAGDPPADDPADPALGPAGEKALAEWKKRAKDAEALTKSQADKLKAFEDAQKTEAEKLADRAKAAEDRATAATQLAVASKVEALATGKFADPSDAVEALKGGTFVSDAGVIDAAAIGTALDELLTRKPHWAAGAGTPRIPAPDPSQGARPGTPPSLGQRIAEAEQKGDTKLAIALKTQQLRELSKTK